MHLRSVTATVVLLDQYLRPAASRSEVVRRRASLFNIRHLLLCGVILCIAATFLIQAPQNEVPPVGNWFLVRVPGAIVTNTFIRQEQQKVQPDSTNLEAQTNADVEECELHPRGTREGFYLT